jgi:hypothetical protein
MKNEYEVRGEVTAIFLKCKDGVVLETLIDTEDLPRAMEFPNTWHGQYQRDIDSYYAVGYLYKNNKSKMVTMHRYLMDVTDREIKVDHIVHNTLDNRKRWIREVTNSQNHQNRKGANSNTKSGVRGVYWKHQYGKWAAQVKVNYKPRFLGYFDTVEEARVVVEQARREMMPFAK